MFGAKYNGYAELLEHAMQIGYARVSTPVQSLALQLDALRKAVCRKVDEEVISGARGERPVLQDMLTHLRRRRADALEAGPPRALAPPSH